MPKEAQKSIQMVVVWRIHKEEGYQEAVQVEIVRDGTEEALRKLYPSPAYTLAFFWDIPADFKIKVGAKASIGYDPYETE